MLNQVSYKSEQLPDLEFCFHRYYGRLCILAKRILTNQDQAEDVVQEVFARLCEKGDVLPFEKEDAQAYLYVTVRNQCLKLLRREKVVDNYFQKNSFDFYEEPTVISDLIHAEAMGELYEAINGLPVGCAEILKKSIFEGLSNQEIADSLELSINTVKSQKRRAISLLRERMGPEMNTTLSLLLIFLIDF